MSGSSSQDAGAASTSPTHGTTPGRAGPPALQRAELGPVLATSVAVPVLHQAPIPVRPTGVQSSGICMQGLRWVVAVGPEQILSQGPCGLYGKAMVIQEHNYLLLSFLRHFATAVSYLCVTLPCRSASKRLPSFFKECFQCLARSLRALDFAAGKVYNMFTIPCIIWL